MAIVVKELIVRATVEDTHQGENGRSAISHGKERMSGNSGQLDNILADSTERVMEILERKKER
ncbi:DUF5908 family protein [Lunatibacter salilacus]|uniref:DUF5908 family protein n=1 Tax=Lunatibacter salilacus TaxID=2483804 RepID=UPI00131ECD2F|nr:DUF5908 family protein [Lunatibacter salilacus]